MTDWTDLTQLEQLMAAMATIGGLTADWTADELRSKAKQWKRGDSGIGAQMAVALDWLADARDASAARRAS